MWVYNKNAVDFSKNGIANLKNFIKCEIREELNGIFSLEAEYPIFLYEETQYLLEENIIYVPTSKGEQAFRIYKTVKDLEVLRIYANHIFWDLKDNYVEDRRAENRTGLNALDWIMQGTQYPHGFTITGDRYGGVHTQYFVERNVLDCILGNDSILSNWGGEFERDNWTIKYKNSIGADRGVFIKYGKNLQGIEAELEIDNVITRIEPKGKDGLKLPELYVDSPLINNYNKPKVAKVEFSDIEDIATLRQKAQEMFSIQKVDIPSLNYKVNFLDLSQTDQYKDLSVERVWLGDTVTVQVDYLGIDIKAKVISYKYDSLLQSYNEIELGEYQKNYLQVANELAKRIEKIADEKVSSTDMEKAISNATNLITGNIGGYVVLRKDANDKPYEIIIMDTEDIDTAKKVWRWNKGGLGFSSTGYAGTYTTAITQDGSIVANFITTGTLKGGKMLFNLDAGTFRLGNSDTDYQMYFDGNNLNLNAQSVRLALGKVGVDNLVKNGNFMFGLQGWQFSEWRAYGSVEALIWQDDNDWVLQDDNRKTCALHSTWNNTDTGGGILQYVTINPSRKYTFQCLLGVHRGAVHVELHWRDANWNRIYPTYSERFGIGGTNVSSGGRKESNYTKVIRTTDVAPDNAKYLEIYIYMAYSQSDCYVFVDNVKVEEGENATAWCPNANEIKNVNIEINDEGLIVKNGAIKVQNNAGKDVIVNDSQGYISVIGGITTFAGINKAINMDRSIMKFYDWEGTSRTSSVGEIYSSRRNSEANKPGFAIANKENAYLAFAYYDKNSNNYYSYIDFDKDNVLGQAVQPIKVWQNMNLNNSTLYFGENLIYTGTDGRLGIAFKPDANKGIWLGSSTGSTIFSIMSGPYYTILNNYPTWIERELKVNGDLYVTGSKNSLQQTEHYGERLVNAYETMEYYDGDIGFGKINTDGECIVSIDDNVQECMNTNIEYHIFTQMYHGTISKIERFNTYFIIYGESGTEFSWEIKAKRKGYEYHRLDQPNSIPIVEPVNFDEEICDNKIVIEVMEKELDFKLDDYLLS